MVTSSILSILYSALIWVECGVDNDATVDCCSDESHEDSCKAVTVSGSSDGTTDPK